MSIFIIKIINYFLIAFTKKKIEQYKVLKTIPVIIVIVVV